MLQNMVVKSEEEKIAYNIEWGIIKDIKKNDNWYFVATFTVEDKRKLYKWAYNENWTFWSIKWQLNWKIASDIHKWCKFNAKWKYVDNKMDFASMKPYIRKQIPRLTFQFTDFEIIKEWWSFENWYIKQFMISEVKWIWEKLANKIFEKISWIELEKLLWRDSNEIIRFFKENKVNWFTSKKLKLLIEEWWKKQEQRRILKMLWDFNLTTWEIQKIYKEYWDNCINVLKRTPYQLIELNWFWFKKVDDIAIRMWIARNSDMRLIAYVTYVIESTFKDDSIYWKDELLSEVRKEILTNKEFVKDYWIEIEDLIKKWLNLLVSNWILIQINKNIFILKKYKQLEEDVFSKLEFIKNSWKYKDINVDEVLKDVLNDIRKELHDFGYWRDDRWYDARYYCWMTTEKKYIPQVKIDSKKVYKDILNNVKFEASFYKTMIETNITRRRNDLKMEQLAKEYLYWVTRWKIEFDHFTLSPEQEKAVLWSILKKLFFICWYAWSWKTTVTRYIVDFLKSIWKTCILLAPTNKACKRLREVHNLKWLANEKIQVKTIHSILWLRKWDDENPDLNTEVNTNEKDYNANWKLKYDYILVDETSMIWIANINKLLWVIKRDWFITFLWDPFQLPSIEKWSFLNDVLESWRYTDNIIVLKTVYRVSKAKDWKFDLWIIWNSQRIREWKIPLKSKWVYVIQKDSFYDEKEEVEKVILWFLRHYKDPEWTFYNAQILCPWYKWEFWITRLNEFCSDNIHHNSRQYLIWTKKFRSWDKVFYNAKNDTYWLVKWDIWTIKFIDEVNKKVFINFLRWKDEDLETLEFSYQEVIDNVELWYVMSIHKAQWSEFDNVMVIVWNNSFTLNTRNLLYTWFTRWKKEVILLCETSAVNWMLRRINNAKNTYLYHLLCNNNTEEIFLQKTSTYWWISQEEEKYIKEKLLNEKAFNLVSKIKRTEQMSYKKYKLIDRRVEILNDRLQEKKLVAWKENESLNINMWYLDDALREKEKIDTQVNDAFTTMYLPWTSYKFIKFKTVLKQFYWFKYIIVNIDELKVKWIQLEDDFKLDFNTFEDIKKLEEYLFVWMKKYFIKEEIKTKHISYKTLWLDKIVAYLDEESWNITVEYNDYVQDDSSSNFSNISPP